MNFPQPLLQNAQRLVQNLHHKQWSIGLAESCTGGLLAALLTEIPGASNVFQTGLVVYADASKSRLLGVTDHILATHGAVSRQTGQAMAQGVREKYDVNLALAITGIAGPGGGSAEKPVGLVYIAGCTARTASCHQHIFSGSRSDIRRHSVEQAVQLGLCLIEEAPS